MENQTQKPKKKIYKRWWFWVLVVIVIFIIIGSSGSKNNTNNNINPTQNNQNQQEAAIKVTAVQLAADYKANQVAADSKYKGKVIEITGTINSIGKDILDTPYVALNSGDMFTTVQCMFDKSNQAELATLSKDTRITLRGTGKTYLMNVLVDNCSVVK
jgi:hypothetical protein